MFIPSPTNNFNLSILFFLQLTIILIAIRLVGLAARRLGQPQVVGEMIAGVVLGPSLIGLFFPGFQTHVFPKESMKIVYAASQVGLVLYMFLVGLTFDVNHIKSRVRSALSVSIAGIATPFALGAVLAHFLFQDADLFGPGLSEGEAMLFMGAAMSITAFPMLARIIYERGLSGTSLGTLALAAGSSDDAAAWCILAIVLASFGGVASIAILAIGGGIAYGLVCMLVLRPMLRRLETLAQKHGDVTPPMLGFTLALLMLGAYFTDAIGIYAVFGAFIMGIAMPRGLFAECLQAKIEPLTTNFLLPLFFVYSGLNTRLTLVNSAELIAITLLILAAAIAGKFIACAGAAKLNGEPWREALAIGALMNARGLMELIILNIGLEKGVVTPRLFSIMVVMAIVTTLMATPIFNLVYSRRSIRTSTLAVPA